MFVFVGSLDIISAVSLLVFVFVGERLTAPMTSYDQPVKVMSKRSFSSTRHTSALATKLLQLHTDPSVYKTTAAAHECTE